MRRLLAVGITALLVFGSAPAFSQDQPQQEEAAPALSEKDVKKLRSSYDTLAGKIKVIRGQIKAVSSFKGKVKDFAKLIEDVKKSITEARKECVEIAALSEAVEWSKAPKLAERMAGELDTLGALASVLKSPEDVNSATKGELKQSDRALKKALQQLGDAPPVAAR